MLRIKAMGMATKQPETALVLEPNVSGEKAVASLSLILGA
jgi:hypothetical protein